MIIHSDGPVGQYGDILRVNCAQPLLGHLSVGVGNLPWVLRRVDQIVFPIQVITVKKFDAFRFFDNPLQNGGETAVVLVVILKICLLYTSDAADD